MYFETVIDMIGHTPLVRLRGGPETQAKLFGKLELMNPFGMKDRFARQAILAAQADGRLKESGVIIESSSGTLAVGLAMVGRALGHEVHIVTDPRIDGLTLTKLRALKAVVHIVDQMTELGWQGARLAKLEALLQEYPDAFWPQQYTSKENPRAYSNLALELLADLETVDVLVGPVGSGGSLCGTAQVLKQKNPALQVVAVDAVGSVIFGQPDNPRRLQSGLGNSLVALNVDKNSIDTVHWLNDEEAFAATLILAEHEQIFAGNSSGSTYWVARWLSTWCDPDCTIVALFPDRGDRYFQTAYNSAYHQQFGLVLDHLPVNPRQVSYRTMVTSWSFAHLKG